jgi:hypothetical protein
VHLLSSYFRNGNGLLSSLAWPGLASQPAVRASEEKPNAKMYRATQLNASLRFSKEYRRAKNAGSSKLRRNAGPTSREISPYGRSVISSSASSRKLLQKPLESRSLDKSVIGCTGPQRTLHVGVHNLQAVDVACIDPAESILNEATSAVILERRE